MIFILSRTTKKHQKILEARPLHSKLKKIQGLTQKFKDFSRKNGFQGLFKTVRTLISEESKRPALFKG